MDFVLLTSILLHSVTNTFGLVANALLIYLVVNRTPSNLTGYSTLILNLAVSDFAASLSGLFVQQRIIPDGLGLYYFSHGPCRCFGSLICYIGYSFMLHCYAHALYSLLFAFSYRFYVLSHSQPKKYIVRTIIALIYIPSFIQFVSFCFASDNESEVKLAISHRFSYDTKSECVSGHLNILRFVTLSTILHMTLPVVPAYMTILILRKLTMSKLHLEVNMSEKSRHLQSQLLKALTIQACLPIFFLLGVVSYAFGQLKICNLPFLEYSTFILFGFIPMLSPLVSIYFVTPYRVWIRETVSRRKVDTAVRTRSGRTDRISSILISRPFVTNP